MTISEVLQGEIIPPGEWTPERAAAYITDAWQNAVHSIVETGNRLIAMKEKLPHGSWLPTVDLLPFGIRTAQVLMQIARHPDLSNAHHDAHLPASYNTLGVLAQLPPGEIPRRIEAHEITPELERSTAQQWVSTYAMATQEALNGWSGAIDGLTAALSYAKTWTPPKDVPDNYVSVAEFIARTRELLKIAESWENDEKV